MFMSSICHVFENFCFLFNFLEEPVDIEVSVFVSSLRSVSEVSMVNINNFEAQC